MRAAGLAGPTSACAALLHPVQAASSRAPAFAPLCPQLTPLCLHLPWRCSGTTGVPKGVMATHKNYVAGVAGARNLLEQVWHPLRALLVPRWHFDRQLPLPCRARLAASFAAPRAISAGSTLGRRGRIFDRGQICAAPPRAAAAPAPCPPPTRPSHHHPHHPQPPPTLRRRASASATRTASCPSCRWRTPLTGSSRSWRCAWARTSATGGAT